MSVNFFNSATENHHNTEPVGLEEHYDLIARILNAKTSNEAARRIPEHFSQRVFRVR